MKQNIYTQIPYKFQTKHTYTNNQAQMFKVLISSVLSMCQYIQEQMFQSENVGHVNILPNTGQENNTEQPKTDK